MPEVAAKCAGANIIALELLSATHQQELEDRFNQVTAGERTGEDLFDNFIDQHAVATMPVDQRLVLESLSAFACGVFGQGQKVKLIDINANHETFADIEEASSIDNVEMTILKAVTDGTQLPQVQDNIVRLASLSARFDNGREDVVDLQLDDLVRENPDSNIVTVQGASHTTSFLNFKKRDGLTHDVSRTFVGVGNGQNAFVVNPWLALQRRIKIKGEDSIPQDLIDQASFLFIALALNQMPRNSDSFVYKIPRATVRGALAQYAMAAELACSPIAKKMMYAHYFIKAITKNANQRA